MGKAVTVFHTYDPRENIVYISFPKVHLQTQQEIVEHFDTAVQFWRDNCHGRRVYYVVDFANFSVDLKENEFYAGQLKRVIDECAITIVRYGGDPLQRTGVRLRSIKLHVPSNIYDSREEALAVVRGLREGTLEMKA